MPTPLSLQPHSLTMTMTMTMTTKSSIAPAEIYMRRVWRVCVPQLPSCLGHPASSYPSGRDLLPQAFFSRMGPRSGSVLRQAVGEHKRALRFLILRPRRWVGGGFALKITPLARLGDVPAEPAIGRVAPSSRKPGQVHRDRKLLQKAQSCIADALTETLAPVPVRRVRAPAPNESPGAVAAKSLEQRPPFLSVRTARHHPK
ncbi:uncharacterized protein K452DRAFT_308030 [Aplosporella prunicola CBS 121167]|uniref:Uncharacterized protein n=1 Tax=Aplosporella prunicola CBS 121167 TaxID=1176127 RepID=A0A6A6BDS2_9PEZI|nr:uncharacterized protein K452DRAFT_308030 [Aplosporella prunicola CBS 121167]KAF2142339.1 hypothetical protein K452DRAFT_308030 [Aplosporella prunicola CBS 121167]